MADSIAVMNGGRVEQLGPPSSSTNGREQPSSPVSWVFQNLLGKRLGRARSRSRAASRSRSRRDARGPLRPGRRRHSTREDSDR